MYKYSSPQHMTTRLFRLLVFSSCKLQEQTQECKKQFHFDQTFNLVLSHASVFVSVSQCVMRVWFFEVCICKWCAEVLRSQDICFLCLDKFTAACNFEKLFAHLCQMSHISPGCNYLRYNWTNEMNGKAACNFEIFLALLLVFTFKLKQ